MNHAVAHVTRRHAVARDEAEDFASWARLKLIENDYAILRKFEGRSKLSTFLITVVGNLFLDYRRTKWGKWRPSAAARRLGAVAIQLESLVYRDGHGFDDAVVVLRQKLEVDAPDAELEEVFAQLPVRHRRRFESDEALERMPAAEDPEEDARERELEPVAARVSEAVSEALGELEAQDATLLRLRFAEGMKVVDIARLLGLEQKKLYPRFEGLLRRLRGAIVERGVSEEQVREVLGWDGLELRVEYGDAGDGEGAS